MNTHLTFHSLGCGIGYGYLHRIPTQPSGQYKKPPSVSPPGTPAKTPQLNAFPLGAPSPLSIPQDSSGPELGSRQSDYMQVGGSICQATEERSVWGIGSATWRLSRDRVYEALDFKGPICFWQWEVERFCVAKTCFWLYCR